MKDAKDLEGMNLAGRGGDRDVLPERQGEFPGQRITENDTVWVDGQRVEIAGNHIVLDRRDVVDLGRDHAVETDRNVLAGKTNQRLAGEDRRGAQGGLGSQTLQDLWVAANPARFGQRFDPADFD